jgi:hypothetical protein
MKRRSKHFGGVADFTSIAEIFISNSGGITTICGKRISNEKVWIKVCNSHSEPDRSIKKAESKLRIVLYKTHKRNSPRATCALSIVLPVLTSIRRIVSESLYILLLGYGLFEKSTRKMYDRLSIFPSLFFTF